MLRQLIAASIISFALSGALAQAGERIALIIGNGDYSSITPPTNPVNDANALEAALNKLNFKVTKASNASHSEMRDAIKRFGNDLQKAGRDGVGLFYYAGHGVQLGGANYLLPVNADVSDASDLSVEGLHIDLIMHQMTHAQLAASFIIIDACRDNPYQGEVSLPPGLAQIRAPRKSIVAFSTEPGGVAADGHDGNSPYTAALLDEIMRPGYPAEIMFKRVRRTLLEETFSMQISWESSSLTEDFYFVDGTKATPEIKNEFPPRPTLEEDWEDYDWDEMSSAEQGYWGVLGWDEESWDEGTYEPASEEKVWNELTGAEQAAAKALGYTKDIWDGTG